MISLNQADEYFLNHLQCEKWSTFNEQVKENALHTAENLIKGHFTLRENAEGTTAYFHAVCEQALHLLTFSKERFQLQNEGIHDYRIDDIHIQMNNAIFSPIVIGFLKPIIKKNIGKIV
ncbi:hypothetical protein [Evansella tamaricis]|uniref:Uncharacterized protein n=1 Tax=Evansella tamaricis TaxID=2069301 RepID=A0ABS6JL67_9BACI|nr:hypothetical protein [Evansella tamaricis]MBU9714422.1 hypothetical protein [Evansella tamaricis]